MGTLQPFILQPVLSERPWGGHRLAGYGKTLPEGVQIGESWEVADLPDGVSPNVADPRSRVASGPFAGDALADVIAAAGDELLGPVAPTAEGRFPLLFKLIDAREHLSIQVHPPATYVAEHPEARLKTESWYVIEAAEDSVLYLGFKDGVSSDDVEAAVGTSKIVSLLDVVPARAGDLHHVPAGLVHALGAGVMVAEVQTPSDTTFRVYDWAEEYGRTPRPLHRREAMDSFVLGDDEIADPSCSDGAGARDLIWSNHYWMREHRVESGVLSLSAQPGPKILTVVSGSALVGDLVLEKGTTAMVPDVVRHLSVQTLGRSVVLEIGLPVPS